MNLKFKRLTGLFLCLCMVLSISSPWVFADAPYTIDVQGSTSIENGMFKFAGGSMKLSYGGTEYTGSEKEIKDLAKDTQVIVTLTSDSNNEPKLRVDNAEVTLTKGSGNDYTYSFKLDKSEGNCYTVRPEFNNNQQSTAFSLRLEEGEYNDEYKNTYGTVEYSIDGQTYKEINVDTTTTDNKTFIFADDITDIFLKVSWSSKWDVMAIGSDGQGPILQNGVSEKLKKDSYGLEFQKIKRTIRWDYNDPNAPEDSLVKNGKILIKTGAGIVDASKSENEGHFIVEPGADVTVYLQPDYGYQFLEGSLNGNILVAGSEVSSFTFKMPDTNLHLSALFTKTDDKIDINTNLITAGTVLNVGDSVKSGNVRLDVSNSNLDDKQKQKMQDVASDKNADIKTYLDINLTNFVAKGSSSESWDTKLTDLDKPVKITLTLAEELRGQSSYYIIREHNEEITTIPAEYNAENGTLTFETDKFSDYAIATSSESANSKYLKTSDSSLELIIMLTFISGLSAVALIKSKKYLNELNK